MYKLIVKNSYCKIGLIIGFSLLMLFFLSTQKEGMHIDEYYSYGLANDDIEDGDIFFAPEQGQKYNAKDVLDEYLFTDSFNIRNVWLNQSADVHPPIYYLLLHLWGLITHNFWGIKTGILLNIIIHVINIILVYLILEHLLQDKTISLAGIFLYGLTPIVLGNVLFIRMYTLLATWTLCLLLLFINYWDEKKTVRFYIFLLLLSILGTLTHYYFLIFLFYSCLVFGIHLLIKHNWLDAVWFVITMGGSGLISVAIFPAMLNHIFSGYRGEESFANLQNSSIIDRINYFASVIDDQVFGGFFVASVVFVVMLLILQNNIRILPLRKLGSWWIVLLPAVLYLVTVSKIAINTTSRYISCLYAVCIILFMGLLYYIIEKTNVRSIIKSFFCAGVIGIVLNSSWDSYTWPELYSDAASCVQTARDLGQNSECIYIYDRASHGLPSYGEFIQYQKISFIAADNLELLNDDIYKHYDQVVVYFYKDLGDDLINNCISQLIENNPGLEYSWKMHEFSYNVSYQIK